MSGRKCASHLTDLHMRHALAGSADRLKRLSRVYGKPRTCCETVERLVTRRHRHDRRSARCTGRSRGRLLLETDPAGYQQSVEESAADYRWMREWLEATGLDWLVIPGNHDLRVAFHEVFGPRFLTTVSMDGGLSDSTTI